MAQRAVREVARVEALAEVAVHPERLEALERRAALRRPVWIRWSIGLSWSERSSIPSYVCAEVHGPAPDLRAPAVVRLERRVAEDAVVRVWRAAVDLESAGDSGSTSRRRRPCGAGRRPSGGHLPVARVHVDDDVSRAPGTVSPVYGQAKVSFAFVVGDPARSARLDRDRPRPGHGERERRGERVHVLVGGDVVVIASGSGPREVFVAVPDEIRFRNSGAPRPSVVYCPARLMVSD